MKKIIIFFIIIISINFMLGCLSQKCSSEGVWRFNIINHSNYDFNLTINYIYNENEMVSKDKYLISNDSFEIIIITKSLDVLSIKFITNFFNNTQYIIENIPVGKFSIIITNEGFDQNYGWITIYE